MFLSFLYPFLLRGRLAPYLWVAYKQMTDLSPEEVCFIASKSYFRDPVEYALERRFECIAPVNPELGFAVPDPARVRSYRFHEVPEAIYRRLKRRLVADSLVWQHLIERTDEELIDFLIARVEELAREYSIEALLTWCNFASLTEVGRRLDLPVIHNELGPLRFPWYNPLGYFDFSGVNGQTEAAARWRDWQISEDAKTALSRQQLCALFSREVGGCAQAEPEYALGIPLQVEDDSNVLAYHRGFRLPLVIQYAQERYRPEDLLLRRHPGGMLGMTARDIALDESPSSSVFVRRCRGLLTLNSSVAVEAMLAGRQTVILGESPARFAAGTRLEGARVASDEELDFLLLHYFVPYGLIFDPGYFRWRLTHPGEAAIRARHLETLRAFPADLWSPPAA